jgi:hypothetical protein
MKRAGNGDRTRDVLLGSWYSIEFTEFSSLLALISDEKTIEFLKPLPMHHLLMEQKWTAQNDP